MLQTRIKNRLIRRGIVALALLATLPGAPVAAEQTFDEAVAAYGRGDYATAVRGFLVHAEQGDASAQNNLGLMYATGEGVLQDEAEAVRWYRLAAEQGQADAQNNLGLRACASKPTREDKMLCATPWSGVTQTADCHGLQVARRTSSKKRTSRHSERCMLRKRPAWQPNLGGMKTTGSTSLTTTTCARTMAN